MKQHLTELDRYHRQKQEPLHAALKGEAPKPANQNACPETFEELSMLSLGKPVVGERN